MKYLQGGAQGNYSSDRPCVVHWALLTHIDLELKYWFHWKESQNWTHQFSTSLHPAPSVRGAVKLQTPPVQEAHQLGPGAQSFFYYPILIIIKSPLTRQWSLKTALLFGDQDPLLEKAAALKNGSFMLYCKIKQMQIIKIVGFVNEDLKKKKTWLHSVLYAGLS